MGGQDAGIPGGTGPGVLWWDRDRVLGSVVGKGQDSGIQARQFLHARDAFLLSPRGEQRCQPRVGRAAAAFRWRRRRCGSSRGAVGAWGQQRTPGGGGCAEPGGSEEHADPPGSRLALPPAGGTDGGTAGGHEDVPDIILVPGRAFHVGHGADLPGHGLSLRGHAESEPAGDSGCRAAPSRPAGR